jgi:hypothetical protein
MAVQHGYGKIAGADALVFAYDTGDTRNSYRGEPTVNLASNANFSNGTTGWNANQNVTLSVETINNIRFLKVKSNQTTSTPGFISGNIAVSGNTTYTLTIRAYKNDNKGIWLYATGNGTGGSDIVWTPAPNGPNPITTELTTISRTFTTPSDMTYLQIGVLWANPLTTSEVYVEYMQLEQKSHATQFVNGTRSATQGLLDLTGNSTIDLINAGFDSNAQLDFDGTSDVIYSPQLPVLDSFSLEVIIKPDALTGWILYRNNSMNYTDNDDNFTFGFSSNKLYGHVEYNPSGADVSVNSTTTLSIGQHAHSIYTYDNASKTLKIYVNGVLEGTTVHTGDSYPYRSTQKMSIGADGGSNHGGIGGNKYFYNGKIPVVKVYNRALTAAEVANNYNHYKGRFNI